MPRSSAALAGGHHLWRVYPALGNVGSEEMWVRPFSRFSRRGRADRRHRIPSPDYPLEMLAPAALRRRGGDRKSKSPPVANARHASRTASQESPLSSPRSCQLDFLIGTKWGSNAGTKQKVPSRGAGPPFAEAAPPLRSLQGWEHNTYDAAGNRTSKTNYRNGLTSIRTMF